ncbi:MAG: HPr-rel-A system PqqD family peptide chaperone [Planctomycetota bacterium]
MSAEIVGTQFALHDPATGQVHFLNESAALIWELCDGTRTVSDITQEVARLYARPVELVASDVDRVVAELRASGLLVPPAT